jgi:hypothetical protein
MPSRKAQKKTMGRKQRSPSEESSTSVLSVGPNKKIKIGAALEKRLSKKLCSTYKLFGGNAEGMPIPLQHKAFLLGLFIEQLDETATLELDELAIDKLFWIYFRMQSDANLARLAVSKATLRELFDVLKRARNRVIALYGDGMLGLNVEANNIDEVAYTTKWKQYKWDESHLPDDRKTKEDAVREPPRKRLAIEDHAVGAPGGSSTVVSIPHRGGEQPLAIAAPPMAFPHTVPKAGFPQGGTFVNVAEGLQPIYGQPRPTYLSEAIVQSGTLAGARVTLTHVQQEQTHD